MPNKVDNKWKVDLRPEGKNGKRVRKSFNTKAEALRYEAYVINQATKGEWNPTPKDSRRLSQLANLWYDLHGHTLSTGKQRLGIINHIISDLGDPVARTLTPKHFIRYRDERLKAGISENHLNHLLTYIKAIFNELAKIGEWKENNPIEGVKKLRLNESELRFLTHDEIDRLLIECDNSKSSDLIHIVKIALSTGCRWSEAADLRAEQVHHGQIHLTKTKTNKNRSIPIDKALADSLPKTSGKLFSVSLNAFRRAIERADIDLPKGQMSHVMRHTFASHFMMNGGNLLTLNKILGHQTIQMTMRYAHLAPDHLTDAIKYNPISGGQKVDTSANEEITGNKKGALSA